MWSSVDSDVPRQSQHMPQPTLCGCSSPSCSIEARFWGRMPMLREERAHIKREWNQCGPTSRPLLQHLGVSSTEHKSPDSHPVLTLAPPSTAPPPTTVTAASKSGVRCDLCSLQIQLSHQSQWAHTDCIRTHPQKDTPLRSPQLTVSLQRQRNLSKMRSQKNLFQVKEKEKKYIYKQFIRKRDQNRNKNAN